MRYCLRRASLGLVLSLWAGRVQAAWGPPLSDDEVFGPMQAELDRSMARLKQDDFGPPYFLAYRLHEVRRYELAASFGSVTQDGDDDYRALYVEARFGGRELDNTDLSYHGWQGFGGRSPQALRQQLWSLTDGAYKSALSGFLEKKAKRATEFVPDVLDDFSVEPSTGYASAQPFEEAERPALRGLTERLSAVFSGYPFIYESLASVQVRWGRRYLLTSEKTRLATAADALPSVLRLSATTRADDGMRLDHQRLWAVRRPGELPPEGELLEAARALAEELGRLRAAAVQEPTAAPAILDPEFTGVLFHEALGHKLEGQRQRDPQQSQIFKDMAGKKVIPDFLSVIDDPTLSEFQGRPLGGYYEYDSEGVPAQRVVLVERGILRSFLMSRWPVKGFPRSNGHGRADVSRHASGRMANLIVEAHGAVPLAELTRRLMALARKAGKPYGFLLIGSSGGENPNYRDSAQTLEVRPRLVYRVDAKTGAKILMRGVKVVGTPLVFLNRILAAGDDQTAATGFVCGAESGHVPVSQITPSVLVSEVELQRLPEDRARTPILPSPIHEAP
ncbi:MAG: metallopeptidase TldD-related protein [Elusimicrobiota bacterium]